jgi:hypothetical protein
LQFSSFVQGHSTVSAVDFWPAFLFLGAITMASAVSCVGLPADAGAHMAGRSQIEAAEIELE